MLELVWEKVWGSYSKTFPDVPDFAQLTVFGELEPSPIFSQSSLIYIARTVWKYWSG